MLLYFLRAWGFFWCFILLQVMESETKSGNEQNVGIIISFISPKLSIKRLKLEFC